MKKTVKINISGLVFNIDEDAYDILKTYLDRLEARFNGTPGEQEIMSDIEARIAEIFQDQVSDEKNVVNLSDVRKAIDILGEPEDFAGATDGDDFFDEEPVVEESRHRGRRRLYRDPENEVIGGVCGGIGEFFNIDPVIIRILFVVFTLLYGSGILIYILLWIAIPEARTTAQKLEMRGERINVSNIEKSIRKEYEGVRDNLKRIPESEGYRRARRGAGQFGRTIGQILVTFIKIIGIIIGASFVLAGIALLVGILGGVMAGHTWLMGDLFEWQEFSAQQILGLFVDESVAVLALICLLLLIGLPVLALIYGGVKLMFPFRANDRAIGFSSFGIWVAALILLAIFALSEGVKYNDTERVITETALELPDSQLYVMVASSEYDQTDLVQMDFGYHHDLQIVESGRDLMILGMPVVDIERTRQDKPFLTVRKESRGVNELAAERYAEQIRFEFTLKDSLLILDPYFRLGGEEKYRGQEVEVVINLPDGYRIFLDESTGDYLRGIDNQEDLWSEYMAGREWVMEEAGLRGHSDRQE